MTKTLAIVVGVAFMLASASAFAGDTGFKVKLVNEKGVKINGKVTAKKGSTVKSCKTADGTCKLRKLSKGSWTLSAKTSNGSRSGGPKTMTAKKGKMITVTIVLKKK
jgi:hypothetical protein